MISRNLSLLNPIGVLFCLFICSACSGKKITVIKVKSNNKLSYTQIGTDQNDCLSMTPEECEVFKLVNNIRINKGINPLVAVENCISAARYHSLQMHSNGKLSHDGKIETWADRVKRFGAIGQQMAENIALATTSDDAVNLWLGSKEHNDNMLNPVFTHTGIGKEDRYWTQCLLEI